jgi:hypothetical protein
MVDKQGQRVELLGRQFHRVAVRPPPQQVLAAVQHEITESMAHG